MSDTKRAARAEHIREIASRRVLDWTSVDVSVVKAALRDYAAALRAEPSKSPKPSDLAPKSVWGSAPGIGEAIAGFVHGEIARTLKQQASAPRNALADPAEVDALLPEEPAAEPPAAESEDVRLLRLWIASQLESVWAGTLFDKSAALAALDRLIAERDEARAETRRAAARAAMWEKAARR